MGKRVKKTSHIFYMSFESLIGFFVIAGFFVTIIVQVAMLNDNIRVFLNSTEKIEGININTYLSNEGTIKLELVGLDKAPNAYVLINGEPQGRFKTKYLSINVKPNQLIEIDGTKYKQNLYVKVLDLSDNVIEPQKTAVTEIQGDIEILGKVKLK